MANHEEEEEDLYGYPLSTLLEVVEKVTEQDKNRKPMRKISSEDISTDQKGGED